MYAEVEKCSEQFILTLMVVQKDSSEVFLHGYCAWRFPEDILNDQTDVDQRKLQDFKKVVKILVNSPECAST